MLLNKHLFSIGTLCDAKIHIHSADSIQECIEILNVSLSDNPFLQRCDTSFKTDVVIAAYGSEPEHMSSEIHYCPDRGVFLLDTVVCDITKDGKIISHVFEIQVIASKILEITGHETMLLIIIVINHAAINGEFLPRDNGCRRSGVLKQRIAAIDNEFIAEYSFPCPAVCIQEDIRIGGQQPSLLVRQVLDDIEKREPKIAFSRTIWTIDPPSSL